MNVSFQMLRACGFMGSDKTHTVSDSFLRIGFSQWVMSQDGVTIDGDRNGTCFEIHADDPTPLFKMLYPESPWEVYMNVKADNAAERDTKKMFPRKYTSALNYLFENHLSDGNMILFDSGLRIYAAFKNKADAARYKLTLP